jgi:hypothetical protein
LRICGRAQARAGDGDGLITSKISANASAKASLGFSSILQDLCRPQTYDVAFNLGTSLVLVPAYMALALTRGRERNQKTKTRKGLVGAVWSRSETKEAPWVGRRGMSSKWLLSSAIPVLLGSIFFFLFGLDTSIFARLFQCCWTAQIPALQRLLQSPATVVQIWSQITLLDFMVARYVFNDSVASGLPYKHSVVLCFLVGPAGLLSHLVTKKLLKARKGT